MLNEAAVREAIDIANWLHALGLERYEMVLRENDIRAELSRQRTSKILASRQLAIVASC